MRKILLILGCVATVMCFAQESGNGGTTTGQTHPDKKPTEQILSDPGEPILGPGPKKKDFARPAPGRWQICTHACWLYGHVVAAAYSWYQPSDVPCGNVAWPDEQVYFCEGYMEHGHVVISDSGWTNGDGMQC